MNSTAVTAIIKKIREEAGDTVTALARLQLSYDKRIGQLQRDMKKSKAGSKTRLDYLRALGKEEREHTELIQSLGYFPKNLGLQTVEKFEFKAIVGIGGDSKAVRTLDAEFTDNPKRLTE